MSSVVIAGNTSGTVTLLAPDIAGTTTLTLPTTSGTVVVAGGAQTIEFADGSASSPSITNSGDTNTGIFFPAADTIGFTEGGTEVMRIDSSGNVGIGTTSPSVRLAVSDASNANNGTIRLGSSSNGVYGEIKNAASSTGRLTLNSVGSGSADGIEFQIEGSNKAMIDSSGRLLVGLGSSVNAGGRLQVSDGVLVTYFTGNDIVFGRNATSYIENAAGTSSTIAVVSNTNGVILNNGATSWSSFSDARLKDVIEPITNALAKVAYINPVIGKYKTDSDGTRRSFLIAQDVQQALPEAVSEQVNEKADGETYLTVSYTDVIPLLVAAIQEQQALITDLTTRLTALENK